VLAKAARWNVAGRQLNANTEPRELVEGGLHRSALQAAERDEEH
jgi:hypothetical protein